MCLSYVDHFYYICTGYTISRDCTVFTIRMDSVVLWSSVSLSGILSMVRFILLYLYK